MGMVYEHKYGDCEFLTEVARRLNDRDVLTREWQVEHQTGGGVHVLVSDRAWRYSVTRDCIVQNVIGEDGELDTEGHTIYAPIRPYGNDEIEQCVADVILFIDTNANRVCADCQRAIIYNRITETYHHEVLPERGCFLIPPYSA